MNNLYIFIVWNKALFVKDKILKDLEISFNIEKSFYIKWNKDTFANNILALYGSKIHNVKEKMHYIGNKKFLVIVIKDNNPKLIEKEFYGTKLLINEDVYNKKWLYRKWTAGNFRIHSSTSEVETKHDLTVLLGPNYEDIINKIDNNSVLEIDTKGIIGFTSKDDFENSLLSFNKNVVRYYNDNIYVFSKNKYDVLCFLNMKNNIVINNTNYNLIIYGEEDGELPAGFVKKINLNNNLFEEFIKNEDDYKMFVKGKRSDYIESMLVKYGLNSKLNRNSVFDKQKETSIIGKINKQIKYLLLKYGKN